ncbi:TetR family transcriptional regulator [Pseudarthrobacter phenanthrenivorans]|uniref:TetR family transcriptional regulator n=1 Tax=Pseudarthrobacter phenanthrenivorans TaxID=361575 RepID=UPI00112659F1|nr:TetR family transcriptional regulator [Pseudarthrobacter phenanthrenivorans]TPV52542.1 TetR family transcriptional regulator [Pseudarthrobacter phenanthrenivorans]
MARQAKAAERTRLNRDRVLVAAVALADAIGIDALSMRRLAQELNVVPMALYKHVSDKEDLLDGMVEVIIREIDPPRTNTDWKTAIRDRVLSARHALQRHSWARQAIETRTKPTAAVLDYQESFAGMFLAGGFTPDLAHHAMHALGGRMWGFTQELFDAPAPAPSAASVAPQPDAPQPDPAAQAEMFAQMAQRYPNIVTIATATPHDPDSVVGYGCDDQFEFEFALDLLLEGFDKLHREGWSSAAAKLGRRRG